MIQPSPDPHDLPALLARVRAGDEDALVQLLRGYEHRIRAAARVMLSDLLRPYLDSLDVVQSVYCALLPGLREGRYDLASPDDLMALAIGVLRRRIARHWRRVRRESPCDAAILQRDASPAPRRSAEHGPAEMASARDQLRSMTADLAAADRLLVEMRVEGFCTAEIAERLGCSEGAIRARLSRLRERLRVTGYRDGP